jgi:hypothetical protein
MTHRIQQRYVESSSIESSSIESSSIESSNELYAVAVLRKRERR